MITYPTLTCTLSLTPDLDAAPNPDPSVIHCLRQWAPPYPLNFPSNIRFPHTLLISALNMSTRRRSCQDTTHIHLNTHPFLFIFHPSDLPRLNLYSNVIFISSLTLDSLTEDTKRVSGPQSARPISRHPTRHNRPLLGQFYRYSCPVEAQYNT